MLLYSRTSKLLINQDSSYVTFISDLEPSNPEAEDLMYQKLPIAYFKTAVDSTVKLPNSS
jgi:hypothetical protein